jgi:hypothetical protein
LALSLAGEIEDRLDRHRQHRAFDEIASFGPEHRLRFRMRAKQPLIDQRRQIRTAFGCELETLLDQIATHLPGAHRRAMFDGENFQKKSRAVSPAPKIVSTLFFPRIRISF